MFFDSKRQIILQSKLKHKKNFNQVFTKKTSGTDEFKDFHPDPEFHRIVFSEDCSNGSAPRFGESGAQSKEKQFPTPQVWKSATDDSTRLGNNTKQKIAI